MVTNIMDDKQKENTIYLKFVDFSPNYKVINMTDNNPTWFKKNIFWQLVFILYSGVNI